MATYTIIDHDLKGEPAVYVGTYGKYNAGSLAGKWLTLSDYSDRDEFYEACQELHGPGEHEFMFQDWEYIQHNMIGESWISEDVWDWVNLDDDERVLVQLFWEAGGEGGINKAREAFSGTASSLAEFAEQFADDIDAIPEDFPTWVVIDWEATWETNLRFDYEAIYYVPEGRFYFFNRNF